jgi:hypothetical protein
MTMMRSPLTVKIKSDRLVANLQKQTAIALNSTPKYHNFVRSNDLLCPDHLSIS